MLGPWFNYSRSERNGILWLVSLIVLVILVRLLMDQLPARPRDYASFEQAILDFHEEMGGAGEDNSGTDSLLSETRISRTLTVKADNPVIELNRCDSFALEALPGIGPVLAARIIKYRELLGGYYHMSQLEEVYGLSPEVIELNRAYFHADSSLIRKIDINTCGFSDLLRHPYLEYEQVGRIFRYRQSHAPIKSIQELLKNELLMPDVYKRIRPYLEAGGGS